MSGCGDDMDCAQTCYLQGTTAGQALYGALSNCVETECLGLPPECKAASLLEGGPCYDKLVACTEG